MRQNEDLDFIWQGDGEEEIYVHTLHGMYGIDYNFKMDQRWYAPRPCDAPLTEECI